MHCNLAFGGGGTELRFNIKWLHELLYSKQENKQGKNQITKHKKTKQKKTTKPVSITWKAFHFTVVLRAFIFLGQ